MKISSHTIVVPDYPQPGESLVFSTRTQAMIKIDHELKKVLDRLKTDAALEDFSIAEADNIKTLHRLGIVVQDEQEEQKFLRDFIDQLKFSADPNIFTVTILTTYGCNLKCVYCFEESSRTTEKLDFATAQHVIEWLKRKVDTHGYRQLYINYYGGEPLLNPKAIECISGAMKEWCHERKVHFKFGMQTNGVLLTPKLVERFMPLGLTSVRISLDGVKEDHDRSRPLRGGGGSFEKIIGNITRLVDKVEIGISMSYDKADIGPIEKLVNYFDEQGILHKLGRFIFAPIHATLGPDGKEEQVQSPGCMCNYEDSNLVEATRKINALMQSKGLPIKTGMATSTCPVTRENGGATIDQKGRLYKCNSMLGHPELSVGDVFGNDLNAKGKEFLNLDVWRQCPQDCTYLPMCSGGCRLSSFLKNLNYRTPTCHKDYLNRMAPELIKKDYQEAMAKKR